MRNMCHSHREFCVFARNADMQTHQLLLSHGMQLNVDLGYTGPQQHMHNHQLLLSHGIQLSVTWGTQVHSYVFAASFLSINLVVKLVFMVPGHFLRGYSLEE